MPTKATKTKTKPTVEKTDQPIYPTTELEEETTTMATKLTIKKFVPKTLEYFIADMEDEDMGRAMFALQEKKIKEKETKIAKKEALSVWKQESGYSVIQDKIDKIQDKIEKLQLGVAELEKTLPTIPAELATSQTKGSIGGVKVSATWKGEGRSKHDTAKLAKQNIKDAKWVCGSIRNISCPHGDATDGTIETKFVKLYEHLKEHPIVEGKNLTTEISAVKDSTYTKGCRFMCRTKDALDKHLAVCKFAK